MGIYQIVAEMPRQQCHQRAEVLTLSFIIAEKLYIILTPATSNNPCRLIYLTVE